MNPNNLGFTDAVLWTIRKFSPHPLLSTPEARAKMARRQHWCNMCGESSHALAYCADCSHWVCGDCLLSGRCACR